MQGNVYCLSLMLGENSEIEGDVKAEDVLIRGRLIGSVHGHNVAVDCSTSEKICSIETSLWSRALISKGEVSSL